MLPFESPRWASFHTYFGLPEEVPQRLTSWRESIGGPHEDSEWAKLWEQFLHQFTITDAAYAAVPHIVIELERVERRKRFSYLVEISLVEAARQKSGAPELPAEFSDSYHSAIAQARRIAIDCLALDWPKIEFRYLMSMVASLHGHGVLGDMLFNLDCINDECPTCGECIYPSEIRDSGYVQ